MHEASGASRRDVLKTGALGVGALAVGSGALNSQNAAAVTPTEAIPRGLISSTIAQTSTPQTEVLESTRADLFLKLDGIQGESQDDHHKNEIEIDSFSFGETNSGSSDTGTGGGAGKVSLSDITITSPVSKASPLLFLACATGQHIKTGVLTVRRLSRNPARAADFLTITLTDVLVSAYDTKGTGTYPTESMSLNFTKIQITYTPQSSKGQPGTPVSSGFDKSQNKAL